MTTNRYTCRIVHELPGRLRINSSLVYDPDLDPSFLNAVLSNIKGVSRTRINIRSGSVVVHYNGAPDCRSAVLDTISHPPEVIFCQDTDAYAHPAMAEDVVARGVAAAMTLFLPRPLAAVLAIGLSLPTLFEGMETLLNQGIKVEVLDASAVGISLARGDYFTAGSISALLALGSYLEAQSEQRSADLLKNLLRPNVEKAWVERDGSEIQVDVQDLRLNDVVICGPGEMIPVDGQVHQGDALVNQSSITGESLSVHVQPGDAVLSGSVIDEGKIRIIACQVGTDTGMARISRFLENSLKSRSVTQKKSDELADRLVPITFGLGAAMMAFTRDLNASAAVLTVDYSCAIKLATPIAVRTAMYTAAKEGVLLKGSEALDTLARIDTIVFDKTGTLTWGKLAVTDIRTFNGMTETDLLELAAGAEQHYSHPVADAVVRAADEQAVALPKTGEVDFVVAHGVSAYINGRRIIVGSRHFVEDDEAIDCTIAHSTTETLMNQGKSILYVADDQALLGIIALKDQIRSETPAFLARLKALGVKKIVVLTGDHRMTAQALIRELDLIDEIHWELKPEDKATLVKALKSRSSRLAFAGDGVNDAPALVTADLGICMARGADLARDSAQMILLEEDLGCLIRAREIAEQNQKSIKTAFKAAVGINTSILILASLGKLLPVTAAILHNTSTLGILGYARMANIKAKPSKPAEPLKKD